METERCGLCGGKDPDKIAQHEHWPGEQISSTPYVHDECEQEERDRAFNALTPTERDQFLDALIRS